MAARFRRMVCATVLVSEALVIGFAVLVAKDLSDVSTPVLLVVGGGGALLCLLLAGMLRRPWAYAVGTLLQVLLTLTGWSSRSCGHSERCSASSGSDSGALPPGREDPARARGDVAAIPSARDGSIGSRRVVRPQ
jgi:hypothetical protein